MSWGQKPLWSALGGWTLCGGSAEENFCLTLSLRAQHTCKMQIHIARNGQPMGPFSLEEVNRQLAAGTLSLSDQAWYEGAAGWAPLSTVPGVSGSSTIGGTSPASPPQTYASIPSAPAVTASTGGPVTASVPAGRTEPLAIWSLVLSLVGLLSFCCGPAFGVGGVVCGHLALSKMKTRPDLEGRGLALAGLIIGYFAAVSWLLYLLFFGGLAVLQGIAEGMPK